MTVWLPSQRGQPLCPAVEAAQADRRVPRDLRADLSRSSHLFWGGKNLGRQEDLRESFHANHHGDGRIALWCKQPEGVQATLVEADPKTFFVPPYVGTSGWLGVRLDRRPDWGMVRDLLEEGYRTVAPKCAIARLDGD